MIHRVAILGIALALAACEDRPRDPLQPEGAPSPVAQPTPKTPEEIASAKAANAPQIYMSLQPDPSGPISIVFAIDAAANNTPTPIANAHATSMYPALPIC